MKTIDLLPYLRKVHQMQLQYWGKASILCETIYDNSSPFISIWVGLKGATSEYYALYPFLPQKENEDTLKKIECKINELILGSNTES